MSTYDVTIGNETDGETVRVTALSEDGAATLALDSQAAKNNPTWGVIAVAEVA